MTTPESATATPNRSRGDRRLPGRARLAQAAMFVLMLLYPPFVIALAGGLIALAWFLVRLPFAIFWTWSLAALLFAYGVFLLFSLLELVWRSPTEAPGGMMIRASDHPDLFALTQRIARRVEARPPDRIVLTPGNSASICDIPIADENGNRIRARVLSIGALNVLDCSAAELAALICHELAHAATGDTWASRLTTRFFESLALALSIEDLDEEEGSTTAWLIHLPLRAYFNGFLLLTLYDSRVREWRADRIAAQVCGPQRTRDLLRKVHRHAYLDELRLGPITERCVHEQIGNIYDLYRARRGQLTRKRLENAENKAFMEPATVWSTHPNLANRFRALAEIEGRDLPSEHPATSLFYDWPRVERKLSEPVLTLVAAYGEMRDRALDRMLP